MRIIHVLLIVLVAVGLLLQPSGVVHAQTVATTGFYNNNSAAIQYVSGACSYENSTTYSRAMNGDIQLSTTNGATVTFTFQGSTVTYWYSMAYNRGSYQVYIDNNYVEQVSAYNGIVMRQIGRTWTVANPTIVHTLKIVFLASTSGTTLDVDGFSVNVETFTLNTDADSSNPAIRRFGSWTQDNAVNDGAWNNSLIYSDTQGDLARYTYSGEWVVYEYSTGPNRGVALVFIDGIIRAAINAYSPNYQRRVWIQPYIDSPDNSFNFTVQPLPPPALNNGYRWNVHTIEILVTGTRDINSSGTRIDVDRIYSKSDELFVRQIAQQQSNWCWVTTVQMVGQYMTGIATTSAQNLNQQCALVALKTPGGSCPNNPGAIWDMSSLLNDQYASLNSWVYYLPPIVSQMSLLDIRTEILNGRPIIARWEWGGISNAHFVIYGGVDDSTGLYRATVPSTSSSSNRWKTPAELLSGSDPTVGAYTWNGYIWNIHR